eukprot:769762-Prorocentrum_minimum.AAC.2
MGQGRSTRCAFRSCRAESAASPARPSGMVHRSRRLRRFPCASPPQVLTWRRPLSAPPARASSEAGPPSRHLRAGPRALLTTPAGVPFSSGADVAPPAGAH